MTIITEGFTPEIVSAAIEMTLKRYRANYAGRNTKLGLEYIRGKIHALELLQAELKHWRIIEPTPELEPEVEFPEGTFWADRD